MKFTTTEAAKAFITPHALAQGHFNEEDILKYAQDIAETIPNATRMAYAPEGMENDVIVLAANYFETYQGKTALDNPGAGNSAVDLQETGITVKGGAKKAELQPQLSDEQNAMVRNILSQNLDKKQAKTAASSVKAILVRAPKPSELYKGIMLKVTDEKGVLPTYQDVLVDTPENKANYNKVVELVKGGKEVAPYLDDTSRKYMGVVITTLDDKAEGAAKTVDRSMNNDMLAGFLAFEVLCRIPSVNDLGVKLNGVKASSGKGRKGETGKVHGIPNIAWDGKSAVIKAGDPNRVIAVSKVKKGEVKTGSLPIAISFEVYKAQRNEQGEIIGYDTNQKGEKVKKTIRLRGKSDKLPVLERIPEYASIFGEEKNGTTIYATLSPTERLKAIEVATDFVDKMGESVAFNGYQEILAAVNGANAAANVQSFQ